MGFYLRRFNPLSLRMLLPIEIVENDEDESCQIYMYVYYSQCGTPDLLKTIPTHTLEPRNQIH